MRTKTLLATAAAAVLLASPFVSSADTLSDLQAQVASLMAQIKTLQTQTNVSGSTSISGSNTWTSGASMNGSGSVSGGRADSSSIMGNGTMVSSTPCITFPRPLSMGAKGDDVVQLQQFLHGQGFLSASATGYFGSMTMQALGQWQSNNGIATAAHAGYGVFGPMSRAHYMSHCGGTSTTTTNQQQAFTADPQWGAAPLAVTFTTSDSITNTAVYTVDFGDGTTGSMDRGSCIGIAAIQGGQGGIRCSYTSTHTYTATGDYTAKLMKNTCPPGSECFVGPLTVATVKVSVATGTTPPTATTSDQRINAPSSVTLQQNGIAEVRNESYYFTLTNLTATSATVQVTPVGCWNSFPSDPTPQIRCMIAVMPIAPITLSIGQTALGNRPITLTQINGANATFSVGNDLSE